MNQPEEDRRREARIETLGHQLVLATELTERARLWREMRAEIEARSIEMVQRMERERGLS